MKKELKAFFTKIRNDVKDAVLEHGLDKIKGFKVTEKGITVIIKEMTDLIIINQGAAEEELIYIGPPERG